MHRMSADPPFGVPGDCMALLAPVADDLWQFLEQRDGDVEGLVRRDRFVRQYRRRDHDQVIAGAGVWNLCLLLLDLLHLGDKGRHESVGNVAGVTLNLLLAEKMSNQTIERRTAFGRPIGCLSTKSLNASK